MEDNAHILDIWRQRYPQKFASEKAIFSNINRGDSIFIASACAEPQHLVHAMIRYVKENPKAFFDAEVLHIRTLGVAPYADEKFKSNFRHNSFFIGDSTRGAVNKGLADYTPVNLSQVPGLFRRGLEHVDVALLQTSLPDEHGYLSVGHQCRYRQGCRRDGPGSGGSGQPPHAAGPRRHLPPHRRHRFPGSLRRTPARILSRRRHGNRPADRQLRGPSCRRRRYDPGRLRDDSQRDRRQSLREEAPGHPHGAHQRRHRRADEAGHRRQLPQDRQPRKDRRHVLHGEAIHLRIPPRQPLHRLPGHRLHEQPPAHRPAGQHGRHQQRPRDRPVRTVHGRVDRQDVLQRHRGPGGFHAGGRPGPERQDHPHDPVHGGLRCGLANRPVPQGRGRGDGICVETSSTSSPSGALPICRARMSGNGRWI